MRNVPKDLSIYASIAALSLVVGFAATRPAAAQAQGCLKCHQGIESIGAAHEDLACEDCHRRQPEASVKEAAHAGLFKNPGDLNIVDQTCGECHEEAVRNVKKSLHATSAGIISGSRYLWAAQEEKNALYAVRGVVDDDGEIPTESGAVDSLQPLPRYSESNASVDDYLRNQSDLAGEQGGRNSA